MGAARGKAPADKPAFKPYWGKPAVRNFRGDDGNVGIMRSPVRAIVLPDRAVEAQRRSGLKRVCENSDYPAPKGRPELSPGRSPGLCSGRDF